MTGAARVTVVDDDPDSRELMAEILSAEGYEVAAFASVSPTLDEVIQARPDLLVIDLHLMPKPTDLWGWDVVRLAKANRSLHTVPIVVVSADLPRLHGLVAETMAFVDVFLVGKPFALDSLTVMARMALRGRQQAIPFPPMTIDEREDLIS